MNRLQPITHLAIFRSIRGVYLIIVCTINKQPKTTTMKPFNQPLQTIIAMAIMLLANSFSSVAQGQAIKIKVTSLNNIPTNYYDEIAFRFIGDCATTATYAFDGNYDAWKLFSFNPNVPSLWTLTNASQALSINSIPYYSNLTGDLDYDLYMKPGLQGGSFELICWDIPSLELPPCVIIELEDLVTSTIVPFRNNTSTPYQFTAPYTGCNPSTCPPRFKLWFRFPFYTSTTINACNAPTGSATVNILSGTGPFTYLWNDSQAQTTQTATNLPAGNYTVTITDGNGCELEQHVCITGSNAVWTLSNTISDESCPGANDGSLLVNPTPSNNPPYTYTLGATTQSTGIFTGLSAGTYTLTVTDGNNCTITTQVTIGVMGVGVAITPPQGVMCENDPAIQLTATPPGGTWSGQGVTLSGVFTPSQAGPGPWTITYTSPPPCSATDQVTINVSASPTVVANQPTLNLCCSPTSQPIFLGVENISTGNVWYTYSFFTPSSPPNSQIGGQFINLPPCGVTTSTFGPNMVYKFDPCNCPAGTYPLTYSFTDANGCSGQSVATMNIVVGGGPLVTFPTMTIDRCTATALVPITPITNGTNCQITGPYVNPQGQFIVSGAGSAPIGTHTIQITCYDANGCSTTIPGTIEVVESGSWHNTTSQTGLPYDLGDRGNDIYTDDAGYVYSTGYFYTETTFSDLMGNSITVNNSTKQEKKFYAVCYDNCGELKWVIYDKYYAADGHWSEGMGIGKNKDELFIALNYSPRAEFVTKYPGGPVVPFTTLASGSQAPIGNVCVLAIDGPLANNGTTFGRINNLEDSYVDTECRALYTRSSNGSKSISYLCGRSDTDNDGAYKVFYSKIKYKSSTGSFSVPWVRESVSEGIYHVANDIKWDNGMSRLLMTGEFDQNLILYTNSQLNTASQSTLAFRDAFMVTMKPNGYIFGGSLLKLGIGPGQIAKGTTVTSNDNNFIHFCGIYKGQTPSPFVAFGLPASASQSNTLSSYILSYDISNQTADFREVWNTTSYAKISGIDARLDEVIFTGFYGPGDVESDLPALAATNPSQYSNQVFLGQLDYASATGWSVPQIVNSTKETLLNDYDHISRRITIGADNYGYVTGSYKGNLSYFSTAIPASGDLNSNAVSPTIYNAFYMRQDIVSNDLRSNVTPTYVVDHNNVFGEENENFESTSLSESGKLKAYPNPTSKGVTISIDGYDVSSIPRAELFTILGEIVYSQEVTANQFDIEMEDLKNGVYLLKVKFENSIETIRIVKL